MMLSEGETYCFALNAKRGLASGTGGGASRSTVKVGDEDDEVEEAEAEAEEVVVVVVEGVLMIGGVGVGFFTAAEATAGLPITYGSWAILDWKTWRW